jgi:hypothetical protein
MFAGLNQNVASNENILTPINSAIKALAIKKDPKTRNKIVRFDSFIKINNFNNSKIIH